ncbi:MAG: UDP-N-acetylmuramoyl-tripeptide--D-alanyl-D-alanine ligase [Cellvibrionales bacterium]|nr:UDP-N-acetylmuramoyl-tripeptide--D-alanyl-D-alanine ligase [Cellvibrionales bacterium]
MLRSLSFASLAHRYGGVLLEPDLQFNALSTDSRALRRGEVFLALKGDKFDGHSYLPAAVERGAPGLIAERRCDKRVPQWVVADSERALGHIAAENRAAYRGRLVGLTGSAGKTTVKEMLSQILGRCGPTLATRGNRNNHLGVPLTLLELRAEHAYAVVEMGASALGEIRYLTEMARPDIALVTNVGDAHLGEFGSRANIERAKGEIFGGLKAGGMGIINLDSAGVARYRRLLKGRRILGFSLCDGAADPVADPVADLAARDIRLTPDGSEFLLVTPAGQGVVRLAVAGRPMVANALAAAAVCVALEVPLATVVAGLEGFAGAAGRLASERLAGDITLIDDSYNASPAAARAAIDLLAAHAGRTILVLGEMAELGAAAAGLHREVGCYAKERGIARLLAVGSLAGHAAAGFGGGAQCVAECEQAAEALGAMLQPGDAVLVKGSRAARLERLVCRLREREG